MATKQATKRTYINDTVQEQMNAVQDKLANELAKSRHRQDNSKDLTDYKTEVKSNLETSIETFLKDNPATAGTLSTEAMEVRAYKVFLQEIDKTYFEENIGIESFLIILFPAALALFISGIIITATAPAVAGFILLGIGAFLLCAAGLGYMAYLKTHTTNEYSYNLLAKQKDPDSTTAKTKEIIKFIEENHQLPQSDKELYSTPDSNNAIEAIKSIERTLFTAIVGYRHSKQEAAKIDRSLYVNGLNLEKTTKPLATIAGELLNSRKDQSTYSTEEKDIFAHYFFLQNIEKRENKALKTMLIKADSLANAQTMKNNIISFIANNYRLPNTKTEREEISKSLIKTDTNPSAPNKLLARLKKAIAQIKAPFGLDEFFTEQYGKRIYIAKTVQEQINAVEAKLLEAIAQYSNDQNQSKDLAAYKMDLALEFETKHNGDMQVFVNSILKYKQIYDKNTLPEDLKKILAYAIFLKRVNHIDFKINSSITFITATLAIAGIYPLLILGIIITALSTEIIGPIFIAIGIFLILGAILGQITHIKTHTANKYSYNLLAEKKDTESAAAKTKELLSFIENNYEMPQSAAKLTQGDNSHKGNKASVIIREVEKSLLEAIAKNRQTTAGKETDLTLYINSLNLEKAKRSLATIAGELLKNRKNKSHYSKEEKNIFAHYFFLQNVEKRENKALKTMLAKADSLANAQTMKNNIISFIANNYRLPNTKAEREEISKGLIKTDTNPSAPNKLLARLKKAIAQIKAPFGLDEFFTKQQDGKRIYIAETVQEQINAVEAKLLEAMAQYSYDQDQSKDLDAYKMDLALEFETKHNGDMQVFVNSTLKYKQTSDKNTLPEDLKKILAYAIFLKRVDTIDFKINSSIIFIKVTLVITGICSLLILGIMLTALSTEIIGPIFIAIGIFLIFGAILENIVHIKTHTANKYSYNLLAAQKDTESAAAKTKELLSFIENNYEMPQSAAKLTQGDNNHKGNKANAIIREVEKSLLEAIAKNRQTKAGKGANLALYVNRLHFEIANNKRPIVTIAEELLKGQSTYSTEEKDILKYLTFLKNINDDKPLRSMLAKADTLESAQTMKEKILNFISKEDRLPNTKAERAAMKEGLQINASYLPLPAINLLSSVTQQMPAANDVTKKLTELQQSVTSTINGLWNYK